ncbi:MAG: hypothetical protein IPK15_22660 [Verrucomicrobia bacterium]|nr:hypothetical protein [Verrucomicrobiota bacterium]
MNVFRLVLCLTGLAVYLLTKQFLPSTEVSEPSPATAVSPKPATVEWLPVTPATPSPAVSPRADVLSATPAVMGMKTAIEQ